MSRTFVLPDGRILSASVHATPGEESPGLGPMWELAIAPGASGDVSVSHPLNSTLADLVGYRVGHEEWPGWIDELAAEIERAFGVSS